MNIITYSPRGLLKSCGRCEYSFVGGYQFADIDKCYAWGTMSAINGDKARFHRERKSKLARREFSRTLRKKLPATSVKRPTGGDL